MKNIKNNNKLKLTNQDYKFEFLVNVKYNNNNSRPASAKNGFTLSA